MYGSVCDQFRRYMNHVMKNLGGHYLNNLPGKAPVEIAPASKELEVLDYLDRQIFNAPMWLYPQDIVSKTGTNVAKDIKDRQDKLINIALSARILNIIYDDSFSSKDALQLDTYLNKLFSTVWKPIDNENSIKNNARRSLQRSYIDSLNSLLNPDEKAKKSDNGYYNSDAILYASQHLDKVESYVKLQAAKATGINKVHYNDILRQIKLIRERQTNIK